MNDDAMCEREATEGEDHREYDLFLVEEEVAQRLRLAADAKDIPYPEAATKAIEQSLRNHEERGRDQI